MNEASLWLEFFEIFLRKVVNPELAAISADIALAQLTKRYRVEDVQTDTPAEPAPSTKGEPKP